MNIDLGQSLEAAVAAPRIHHQWSPDKLILEKSHASTLVEQLKQYGHAVQMRERIGVTQAIARRPHGRFAGVFDPRVPGKAAGF